MTEALRKRIAALKAKAADRAVTEAEAMAAAEMAADLMRSHGLSDADLEFDEAQAPLKTKGKSPRDLLWGTVASCTNCSAVLQTDWTPSLLFIGRAPGPEIATYLVAVLNRAIDREIEAFKATPTYKRRRSLQTRRQAVHDFTAAMVFRLTVRLRELFADSMDAEALIEARRMRDLRVPGSTPLVRPDRKVRFANATDAGWKAGSRVPLSHGVNGGSHAPLQIGGQ